MNLQTLRAAEQEVRCAADSELRKALTEAIELRDAAADDHLYEVWDGAVSRIRDEIAIRAALNS